MERIIASKGLAKAKEIYAKRDSRVRELKAEGKKIMRSYPPLEMITAMDYVPWAARKKPRHQGGYPGSHDDLSHAEINIYHS